MVRTRSAVAVPEGVAGPAAGLLAVLDTVSN
jgi:hypothetical protein